MYKCKNLNCDEQFKYSMQLLRYKKKCNKNLQEKSTLTKIIVLCVQIATDLSCTNQMSLDMLKTAK